jgi:hypothetical protein
MIFAFDLDEVLADFVGPLLEFHNRVYQTKLTREHASMYDLSGTLKCSREEVSRRMDEFYKSHEFFTLPAVDGAKEVIGRVKKKYELAIVTSRPSSLHEPTVAWLNTNFPHTFSGPYFSTNDLSGSAGERTKAEICKNIGAMAIVEDHPEYARQCSENGIHVLLFSRPWNKEDDFPAGKVTRVDSWGAVEEEILRLSLNGFTDSHH